MLAVTYLKATGSVNTNLWCAGCGEAWFDLGDGNPSFEEGVEEVVVSEPARDRSTLCISWV